MNATAFETRLMELAVRKATAEAETAELQRDEARAKLETAEMVKAGTAIALKGIREGSGLGGIGLS
jgi:hypothetical protein